MWTCAHAGDRVCSMFTNILGVVGEMSWDLFDCLQPKQSPA